MLTTSAYIALAALLVIGAGGIYIGRTARAEAKHFRKNRESQPPFYLQKGPPMDPLVSSLLAKARRRPWILRNPFRRRYDGVFTTLSSFKIEELLSAIEQTKRQMRERPGHPENTEIDAELKRQLDLVYYLLKREQDYREGNLAKSVDDKDTPGGTDNKNETMG